MVPESTTLRVLAITRKPHSASYEQRIANYIGPLKTLGVEVDTRVYPKDLPGQVAVLLAARHYDLVWWHRHLLPWWQLRLLRKFARTLVYDFDDPVCFSTRDDGSSGVRAQRFARLVGAADAVMAGSHYLRDLAEPHNPNVHIVPMAIDLPDAEAVSATRRPHELLWLGSESTQKYLELIRPALESLGERHPELRLRLVAHRPMQFGSLHTEFVHWTPHTQEQALRECGIGLCPLPDTPWSRGKCPYKVLQYMSHGMPWVGAAIGENIVTAGKPHGDEVRGLTAQVMADWVQGVESLLEDAAQRRRIGHRARAYIEEYHERHHIAARIAGILRAVSDAALGHA